MSVAVPVILEWYFFLVVYRAIQSYAFVNINTIKKLDPNLQMNVTF